MTYIIPDNELSTEAPAIAARMIAEYPEFSHLKDGEAIIAFLMDTEEEVKAGKRILGTAHLPEVQGRLRGVFRWMTEQLLGYKPDFIITLDNDYWQSADATTRDILVFHELSHCVHKQDRDGEDRYDEDGRPVFGLVSHDVEEFIATVKRYGAYSDEIKAFIAAAQDGR